MQRLGPVMYGGDIDAAIAYNYATAFSSERNSSCEGQMELKQRPASSTKG